MKRREGGIIWHTQGSGKSLTMVWLAKWIREHVTDARVLLITDRTELDEQIEKVFKGVSEDIHRTRSGADLVRVLNTSDEWLIASLIHKFGAAEEGDVDDREAKALALDRAIRRVKKADWRGSRIKEREVRNAIHAELGGNESLVSAIFEIVKAQSEY